MRTPNPQTAHVFQDVVNAYQTKAINFSKYFYSIPIPSLISDVKEGWIIDANDYFLKMFDYKRKDVIAKSLEDLPLWTYAESGKDGIVKKIRKEPLFHDLTTTVRRKDGSLQELFVTSNRISLDGADFRIISFRDFSIFKQTETLVREGKEGFRFIEDNVHYVIQWFQQLSKYSIDCLYIQDTAGNFIDVNDATLNLVGYTREEFTSLNIATLAGEENLATFWETLKERKKFGFKYKLEEYKLRRKDGDYIYVEGIGFPLMRGGEPFLYLGMGRDITDRKKKEEELKTKTLHLEESNAALKALLRQREQDKHDMDEKILINIRETINPFIEKLRPTALNPHQRVYFDMIESGLDKITAPLIQKIKSHYPNFTQSEIRVSNLLIEGKNSKEIADIMNVSERAIEFHRYNIRKKLGINKKRMSLKTYLLSLP